MKPDRDDKPETPRRPRGRLVYWASILLPFVLGLRAILLVFQLGSERHPAPAEPPHLPWPPETGEVLRFEARNAGLQDWALDRGHRPLPAALIVQPRAFDKGHFRIPRLLRVRLHQANLYRFAQG